MQHTRQGYSSDRAGQIVLDRAVKRRAEAIRQALEMVDRLNPSELSVFVESRGVVSTNESEDYVAARCLVKVESLAGYST